MPEVRAGRLLGGRMDDQLIMPSNRLGVGETTR